jgi:predicted O-methyltransferase YrrM
MQITLPQFKAIFGWVNTPATDTTYANPCDRQVLNTLNAFLQPARVMEIGINEGRTAELLLRCGPWIRHYCGIDVPPEFTPTLQQQRSEIPGAGKIACRVNDPRLHTVTSTVGTYPDMVNHLTGKDFNLIFIDADHSYTGVKRDTEIAFSAISPRGCIVWHDYSPDLPDIVRFINESNRIADRIIHVQNTRICFRFITSDPDLSDPSNPSVNSLPEHRTPNTEHPSQK